MSELFLTGMFRSGSTTLARALNSHKNIAFASDPYLEILKSLRSDLAADLVQDVPFMQPLSDYYFSDSGLELLTKVEQAEPSTSFDSDKWNNLLPVLQKRCGVYSESLVPYLDKITGVTYREVMASALNQVRACYGDDQTLITGFKEVWAVEFIPFFLECFPKAKTILLQRDPRAVCASKNKTDEKYPWIFLCRQWRKIAALGWSYAQDPKYKDRVLLVNFEDFVKSPEEFTKRICDFLEIDWDPDMADASCYKGGGGEVWKQNTSYGDGKTDFDQNAMRRWQTALSEDECAYIEYMCSPEMSLYGYDLTIPEKQAEYWLENSPRINDADQANWMRELVPNDPDYLKVEMQKEMMRRHLLLGSNMSENRDQILLSYLKEDVYKKLY